MKTNSRRNVPRRASGFVLTGYLQLIRPERRDEDWPPENMLIKWRSHAGYGFNLSTMCLL